MHRPLVLASLLTAASVASAQVDLQMNAGSLPGSLGGRLGPYQPGFPAIVILSVSTGPTFLSAIDARDPRQLRVGIESLPLSFAGVFAANGYFDLPAVPIPNLPWFVNRSLFFQALTLEESVKVAVQVNGKLRGTIELARGAPKAEAEKAALALPNVSAALNGQPPKRVIVVPDKIVNVVV